MKFAMCDTCTLLKKTLREEMDEVVRIQAKGQRDVHLKKQKFVNLNNCPLGLAVPFKTVFFKSLVNHYLILFSSQWKRVNNYKNNVLIFTKWKFEDGPLVLLSTSLVAKCWQTQADILNQTESILEI